MKTKNSKAKHQAQMAVQGCSASLDRSFDILSMIVNLSAVTVKCELTLTARAMQNRPTGRKPRDVRIASYRPESSLLLCAKC